MKPRLPLAAIFAGLFLLNIITVVSCKKTDVADMTPKEELALGKWNINRMQLKIYSGGVFIKDTIIKQTPHPENFVNLGSDGSFEYRFNTTASDFGSYEFAGADSLVANSAPNAYRWKTLTITKDIFTVMSTSTNDTHFPGYLVESYQTFVRYK